MLKKLTKEHKPKIASIEGNTFNVSTVAGLDITPELIELLLTKKYNNYFIYTYQDNFLSYNYKGIDVKRKYIGTECLTLTITKGRYKINLINARFLLPQQPPSLISAITFIYSGVGKGLSPALTAATFALKLWRYKYQKETLRGISERINNFVREAYAGGRSEILQSTLQKGYYYDINSMYADMMCNDMPTGLCLRVWKRNKDRIGFYRCKVDQTNLMLPPLWKKIYNQKKGKAVLAFPADKFEGVFSGVEIDNAINSGVKIKVINGYEWQGKQPIFKQFAQDLYKIRQLTTVDWYEAFIKKLLVSLYGKFAQTTEGYTDVIQCQNVKEFNAILLNAKNVNTKVIDEENLILSVAKNNKPISKYNSNLPHLSAHIIALSRVKIYDEALKVILNGGKVAYIETDALFTSIPIKHNVGSGLGQWKLEGEVENAHYYLSKTYKYDFQGETHYIAAGVNGDMAAYFKGENITMYKKQKFSSEAKAVELSMKNNFIKRDVHENYSMPLSIKDILSKMNITKI